MNSSDDIQMIDLREDVDHLLFLCDRLQSRLQKVTSNVDEIKRLWISKRQAIESDGEVSPLIVQKATKCNKVLLTVTEKLATVELQTEALQTLQSVIAAGSKTPLLQQNQS